MGTAGSHPHGDSSAQWLSNGGKTGGRGASSAKDGLFHPLCWLLVTSIQKIGISAKNITKEQPSRTGSRSHLPKREHLSSSGPSCFAASSARKAKL